MNLVIVQYKISFVHLFKNKNMKYPKKLIFFIAMLVSVSPLLAQISVSGNVIDQDGQPIPGVTILDQEDNSNGTVTDFDGAFTINIPSDGTLSVSFIGYVTQSISVSGQTNLNVTLEENISALDEIVITGYGEST